MLDDILKSLEKINNFAHGSYEATHNEAFFKLMLAVENVKEDINQAILKAKDEPNG